MKKLVWAFILNLVFAGAYAQLPAGFTPPVALTEGRLQESTAVLGVFDSTGTYEGSRAHNRLLRRAIRELRRFTPRGRKASPEKIYPNLRELAEDIVNDPALKVRPTILRKSVTRALFLLDQLEFYMPMTTPLAKRHGAMLIANGLLVAYKMRNDDIMAFYGDRIDHVKVNDELVRMYSLGIMNLPNDAARVQLSQDLVSLLIWDKSMALDRATYKTQIDEAWSVLQDIQADSANQSVDQIIGRMESLKIMPHAHMQENFRPLTPGPLAEERALLTVTFNKFFEEAKERGVVVCAAVTGDNHVILEQGILDGSVQEALMAKCLSMPNANGPYCRSTLTCNRQSDVARANQYYLPITLPHDIMFTRFTE